MENKKFVDVFSDFINETTETLKVFGVDSENDIVQTEGILSEIGKATYLDVDGLRLEPIAVLFLPDEYDVSIIEKAKEKENAARKEFPFDAEGIPEELSNMFEGIFEPDYEPIDDTLYGKLEALEFTIIDAFPHPNGNLYFKVQLNGSNITAWLPTDTFKRAREHTCINGCCSCGK